MGGGTGFCTLGVVKSVNAENVTLIDQSPHQLAKAKQKPALQGVTIMEVSRRPPADTFLDQPAGQRGPSLQICSLHA